MPDTECPRDRYGRPLIVPPEGGKPIPYSRASSFGDALDDTTNLDKHHQRKVAEGLTLRPDLVLAIASLMPIADDDRLAKKRLNELLEQAMEAAGSSVKSTIGTSLHTFTERIDRGEELGPVPAAWLPDLRAYERATRKLEVIDIEKFVVNDYLQVAGTYDRRLRYLGCPVIGDLKTGSIYGMGKIAIQEAAYANADHYDPATSERTEFLADKNVGLVIHLPQGEGHCEVIEVDIAKGWAKGATLVPKVKEWRGLRTKLAQPLGTWLGEAA